MSFIAITYGYNLYSVFNIDCTTLPLIDNIVKVCISNIRTTLPMKQVLVQNELSQLISDEDAAKKQNSKLEVDKQKEEERLEEQRKLKEIESKIPEKGKKKETVISKQKPTAKKSLETNLLQIINDEIAKNINLINSVNDKRDKYDKKLKQLKDIIVYYENLDESKLKIDLIDLNLGSRIEIETKENEYANTYLVDKQCYELVFQRISKFY